MPFEGKGRPNWRNIIKWLLILVFCIGAWWFSSLFGGLVLIAIILLAILAKAEMLKEADDEFNDKDGEDQ